MTARIDLVDLAATEAFAARLAQALRPPLVIGLIGDLGAGKTALVRAMIQTLAPGTRVKSPTYTLIESYALPGLHLHHLDLYRLRHPAELADLGLADLLGPHSVLLIEWPDKGGDYAPTLDVAMHLMRGEGERRALDMTSFSPAGSMLESRIVR